MAEEAEFEDKFSTKTLIVKTLYIINCIFGFYGINSYLIEIFRIMTVLPLLQNSTGNCVF